jgi:hypothetical protein
MNKHGVHDDVGLKTVVASDLEINNSRKQFNGTNRHDKVATNRHRLLQLNKFSTFLDLDTVLSDSAYNSIKESVRKCANAEKRQSRGHLSGNRKR